MPLSPLSDSRVPTWYACLCQHVWPETAARFPSLPPSIRLLAALLWLVPLASWLPPVARRGRRPYARSALAAAFLAKAVLDLPTTRALLDRLQVDARLRTLCGWDLPSDLPSESTFSRAFAQFAALELPDRWQAALIHATQTERLVGHIARDGTAVVARERFPKDAPPRSRRRSASPSAPRRRRGRSKGPATRQTQAAARQNGTRLARQRLQTLAQMRRELPTGCSLGVKVSSQGHRQYWRGYKLHLDVADGQIPISALLTGAHVHDSQVALPLMTMTAERGLTWCYDVMDSAYDAEHIHAHSRQMGHVPLVQPHPRRRKRRATQLPSVLATQQTPEMSWAEQDRFRERTMVERVFARLKDEFGGRHLRVRGARKAMAHLGMGLVALTVDQLLRWAATAEPSTTPAASAT